MAFTSIKNEPIRIAKQMQEMTQMGRYMNNVPGPSDTVSFFEDPQIRLQKWGANLRTNTINLESDLMGLSRDLNRDNIKTNNYENHKNISQRILYGSYEPFVEESRAIMPAWTLLDKETNRWEHLENNPKVYYNIPFNNNVSSRIQFKDKYNSKN